MQAKNFNIWSRGAQKKAALQLAFSFGKYPLASGLRKFDMVENAIIFKLRLWETAGHNLNYLILRICLWATKGKKVNQKLIAKIYCFLT